MVVSGYVINGTNELVIRVQDWRVDVVIFDTTDRPRLHLAVRPSEVLEIRFSDAVHAVASGGKVLSSLSSYLGKRRCPASRVDHSDMAVDGQGELANQEDEMAGKSPGFKTEGEPKTMKITSTSKPKASAPRAPMHPTKRGRRGR